jgi:two-component system sensor histidine kinase KdpD
MPQPGEQRPDPDTLLARVQEEEAQAKRGRLRIYFGSSAGVGKTYAMLWAARQLKADGVDVVVGIVETHGRSETAVLTHGLEILSRKRLEHRGRTLEEFDLDAALARRPTLILVDELAHSNVAGSRHPKRWQDVEELLGAGIDVFTTLNVQHLESLNDVVGGITQVRVWETLPDKVFDDADEVVLVDITADELLDRLRAGKVYLPQQIERAAGNFFRKGNLMALREIALRRTADRIEDDVQAYRVDKAISPVWKTEAALLVCVGPDLGSERLVRAAARLAGQLNVSWHAIYVETPKLQRLPPAERERILAVLKLAAELEAKTAVLASPDVARSAVEYARSHNLSRIVIGRTEARAAWLWQARHARSISNLAPDIDLIEIGRAGIETARAVRPEASSLAEADGRDEAKRLRYLWAVAACVATTVIASPLHGVLELANIVMLFLLTVALVAVKWGRGPATLASVLAVASFDFFFVPPRFSFAVSDVQYLLTFAVMLAVALIIGNLTSGLRFQARVAAHREERSRALYEFARDLTGALQTEQVVETSDRFLERSFRASAALLLPDDGGRLRMDANAPPGLVVDSGIAQWAFDKSQAAGFGTDTLPGSEVLYLPLKAPMRTRGVLAIRPESRRLLMIPEQRQQLDTFAALIAIALERVHYVEVARDALVTMESERLRTSLLSALSHDLRTPLTVLVALSESLSLAKPPLSAEQADLAQSIREEARRMGALVANLLDMARLETGGVKPRLEWQPFEEVVGSSLAATREILRRHRVETRLARDLPLVRFDAVLVERVLVNLLENASKYTPAGSTVVLGAQVAGSELCVTVSDDGPGLPPGREEAVFQKFTRGEKESATPGVGLGLAICRAIVEAHGGAIRGANRPEGGAVFTFTLPLGTPPEAVPATEEEAGANG